MTACTSTAPVYAQPDGNQRPVQIGTWRCDGTPVRLWRYPDGDVAFCAACEPFTGTPVTGWTP